ncbi:MAG: tetratricopeptide repeat protein [Lentimicrobiaceae bacterium]|nr:tetratricopeptide repeat protein [Lentimicrobiaceae bacterium]MCB9024085.1 tetratricopeptide repeat protein [Lentimicrobiaceae bacterium]MCO5267216.1 tetratricopeptide repeat protein [Lentimicrobium sp.]HPG32309.1 tetratricopeptide repeat protein [Lentimicrobium sp.]
MAKKTDNTEEKIMAVEEALSKTEVFIEKNQKLLTIILGSIAILVLAYFAFQRFYLIPKEKEAQSQMFMAEKYFEQDSLKLALNGDGMYPGFLQIIDDYGMTKSAKLAHYYSGIILLNEGKYQEAIDHLEKFSIKDVLVAPMAKGAIGDAYMELGKTADAAGYYLKAADLSKNDFTSPVFLQKAAWAFEDAGKKEDALKAYERIRTEYPRSNEARDVEKYVTRLKGI